MPLDKIKPTKLRQDTKLSDSEAPTLVGWLVFMAYQPM